MTAPSESADRARRRRRLLRLVVLVVLQASGQAGEVAAQLPAQSAPPSGKLPAPRIQRPTAETRRRLARLRWLADNHHAEELANLSGSLSTEAPEGWVEVGDGHYVGVQEAVQRTLVGAGADALAAYRQRFDPLASAWLHEGREKLDAGLLCRVVDQAYATTLGDDALWALGELNLERGDFQAARWAWQQIKPETASQGSLTQVDSPLDLAAVRSRLTLVSIRAGEFKRADRELRLLSTEHSSARGRLGGREVNFSVRLAELLEVAKHGARVRKQCRDWPTMASAPQRSGVASVIVDADDVFERAWTVTIEAPLTPLVETDGRTTAAPRTARQTFPVVVDQKVIFQDARGIHALRLEDGKPAFSAKGLIFATTGTAPRDPSDRGPFRHARWPVFALTASDSRVLGLATPRTELEADSGARRASQLVGLDLDRDGALAFHHEPSVVEARYLGPPIVKDATAIVVELHEGAGDKAGVAGIDFWRPNAVWRRALGSADTIWKDGAAGRPMAPSAPTLAADSSFIYVSTNLGFVAALRCSDGAPLWLRTYERSAVSDGATYSRLLDSRPNPCVVQGSIVVTAPYDSPSLFALDAATGARLWSRPLPASDAQILAVDDRQIVVSGDGIWAFDLISGKADPSWGSSLRGGAGQGVVAGDVVLWPTSHEILLIDLSSGHRVGSVLVLPDGGGANLAVAADAEGKRQYIIAAGPTHVTAYRSKAALLPIPSN